MKPDLIDLATKHIEEITSLMLWRSGAIKTNTNKPFRLASGNYSPLYINCRQVISDPVFMDLFCAFSHALITWNGVRTDIVAGGETAGIPFAAYIAQRLGLPMVYVRKKAKEHGVASLVEGSIEQGTTVLLVEDLITDAASKLRFVTGI
jgi:orotate phosphoribosyltransferase